MIKSIFFRALTLLGLTFVLIGCGAADPGEGGTGTPGTAGAAALSMDDVTKEVEKLIRDSKGKLDTTDGVAVATKIVSIMKASQPLGSCSLFSTTVFPDFNAAATAALADVVSKGSNYPGGSGTLTINLGSNLSAAGVIDANTVVKYTYANYSIDGIYFLDGELKFTSAVTTAAATAVSSFTAQASTLTLSEGGVAGAEGGKIAKLVTATSFIPAFTATAGAQCGQLQTQASQANAVTISPEAAGKFTDPVVLAITTAGTAGALVPAGTNVGLFHALIGPRYS